MEIVPNSDWILVNRAIDDHVRNDDGTILIEKPQITVNYGKLWAEIVDIGPKCKYITKNMCESGHFIDAYEVSNGMKKWYQDENRGCEFYFIKESYLMDNKSGRGYIIKM